MRRKFFSYFASLLILILSGCNPGGAPVALNENETLDFETFIEEDKIKFLDLLTNVSNLKIYLNDELIPQDNTNGWSFDLTTQILSFNGIDIKEGDKLSVRFEYELPGGEEDESDEDDEEAEVTTYPAYNPAYTTPYPYNQQYQQLYGEGYNYCNQYAQGCVQCMYPVCNEGEGCSWNSVYYAQPGYYAPQYGQYGQGGAFSMAVAW